MGTEVQSRTGMPNDTLCPIEDADIDGGSPFAAPSVFTL